MMLPQIDHCAVLTVEGLAAPAGALHPVQRAMIDTDATQCGFCTPGFVMAMFAFHHGGEPARRPIIHEALAGNLCRCTGYRSIVEACRRLPRARRSFHRRKASSDRRRARGVAGMRRISTGTQIFLRRVRLTSCSRRWRSSPTPSCLPAAPIWDLRVSKDREALPAVIAVDAVQELRESGPQPARSSSEARSPIPKPSILSTSFSVLRRARAAHRLATNSQSRNDCRQSRDRFSHRRYPPLPDRARRQRDARFEQRRADPVGGILHYRIPQDCSAAGRGHRSHSHSLPCAGQQFAVYKFSKRFDQDISTVIAAFCLERRDGGVSQFCVPPMAAWRRAPCALSPSRPL